MSAPWAARAARPALLLLLPLAVSAQELERCIFQNTPTTTMQRVQQPSGEYNTFMGKGVFVRCPGKDLTLRADSLESYGDEGRLFLLGRVRYNEPRLALTSDKLTYHQNTERIVATDHAVVRLPSGSTLEGPVVDYYRATEARPARRLFAPNRPKITLVQKDTAVNDATSKDSTSKASMSTDTTRAGGDTAIVYANTVTMIGDSLVYAGGNVDITNDDVQAKGDSATIDTEKDLMVLMRDPSITSRNSRPYTLTGTRIELVSENRKLNRVLALGEGKAVSEDMTLASDTIDLRVADDLLQRAIAWGPGRARASSPTQEISADSIDVAMPGQRLKEMHAVRGASAHGQPDTAKFKADTVDWLQGDTIIAKFDTALARDTASHARQAQLKELLARGTARSYYHMTPSDTTIRKAAINYVRGRQIVVAFAQRRASKVTVTDKAAGVYVEPRPEPKPAAATQTKAPQTKTPPPSSPTPPKPPE